MINRKVLYKNGCFSTVIPKTFASILGLKPGDTINFELIEDKKIMIALVQTAKPELSRNVQVDEGGKATFGDRSPIIEAQDNGKITTGDNSPINQNIFIQLFWSKGTIGGAIIVIVLNIIYYFWRKKKEKKTLWSCSE